MSARHSVTIRHNAEAGHRLPHLGGKCVNLHGHSWGIEVEIGADELTYRGIVTDFGWLKGMVRGWVDTHLDHGVMLGAADHLVPVLRAEPPVGLIARAPKVFVFGDPGDEAAGPMAGDLAWPTVENVAVLLARVVRDIFSDDADLRVERVTVTETAVNAATFRPPAGWNG